MKIHTLMMIGALLAGAAGCGDEGLAGSTDAQVGADGGGGGGDGGATGASEDSAGTADAVQRGGTKDTGGGDGAGASDAGTGAPGDVAGDAGTSPSDGGTQPDGGGLPDSGAIVDAAGMPDGAGDGMAGPDGAAPEEDTAAVCSPTPFAPGIAPQGWNNLTTELFTVTQGSANHRGQDVVAREGSPQVLIGKFAYGTFDKDLKGEVVEVFVQPEGPCGPWVSLGTATTSEDGQYGSQYGIEDDGGRVFFEIPGGEALPVGFHAVRMLVHGDLSVAAFRLVVVPAGTEAVVFDIDGTLTTDDFELVKELFADLFLGSYVPTMREGGLDVVSAWADHGVLLVYLTGRPDTLRAASEGWLVDEGFPPGAVHLTDTSAQALPTSAGVAAYKADFLTRLKAQDVVLRAAYGNATTDIEGYDKGGVPKDHTFIIGTHAGEEGTVGLPSYPEHLPAAVAMPDAALPAPAGSW